MVGRQLHFRLHRPTRIQSLGLMPITCCLRAKTCILPYRWSHKSLRKNIHNKQISRILWRQGSPRTADLSRSSFIIRMTDLPVDTNPCTVQLLRAGVVARVRSLDSVRNHLDVGPIQFRSGPIQIIILCICSTLKQILHQNRIPLNLGKRTRIRGWGVGGGLNEGTRSCRGDEGPKHHAPVDKWGGTSGNPKPLLEPTIKYILGIPCVIIAHIPVEIAKVWTKQEYCGGELQGYLREPVRREIDVSDTSHCVPLLLGCNIPNETLPRLSPG